MGVLVHLSHIHALEENKDKTEFVCNGCNEKGNKGRYECAGCGFYLHAPCAKAPKMLKKCSKHDIDGHHMELNYINVDSRAPAASPSSWPTLFFTDCKSCGVPITSGLFYRCKVCSLTFHMSCAASSKVTSRSQPQPQKPQAQYPAPHATAPPTTGRKRKIAKRIATGLLVGTAVVALKGALAIATAGTVSTFDGSEFCNFVPDLSDLFDGGDECEACDVPQESGTDDRDYDGAGDEDEFVMEFDFGCDEEDEDNSENWEYSWE